MHKKDWRNLWLWGRGESSRELTSAETIHHAETFVRKTGTVTTENPDANGSKPVSVRKTRLKPADLRALVAICGSEDVSTDDWLRASRSAGKFYTELLRLRMMDLEVCDAVVFPSGPDEVLRILQFCSKSSIAVVPAGARSSVTRALESERGRHRAHLVVDLTRHMNRLVSVSVTDCLATAEAGILGPELEAALNNFENGYTCGHFPQSFEFSTVGGWLAARGAGQYSTGYGKFEEIAIAAEFITTQGIWQTPVFPASSTGPDLFRLIGGSEGWLGVITKVTLRIRPLAGETYSSFVFRDFPSAVNTMRLMMQSGSVKPALFRISDAEETDFAMALKGKDKGFPDFFLKALGFPKGKRVLLYASWVGERAARRAGAACLYRLARRHSGFFLGGYAVRKWLDQRYSSAYLRDPVMAMGTRLDTIETSVAWSGLLHLHHAVREYVHRFPGTLCLTHISHVYENGANLYFVYAMPMAGDPGSESDAFLLFHTGLLSVITGNGGSLSHHHGVGRMSAPWFLKSMEGIPLALLKGIKKSLDPRRIMNPGNFGL